MTTNQTTTNQGYEKPYPSNLLAVDVTRLQNALDAIDTDMAARPLATSVTSEIAAAIAALVDASPSQLDTLNELAQALGDDSNFATTVTTALAAKADTAGESFTGLVDFNSGIEVAGGLDLNGKVIEQANIIAAAPSATQAYSANAQVLSYHTVDATNNFTANFTGLSGLAVGDVITFAVFVQNGASAYYMSGIQVDGTSTGVTSRWQNNAAPVAGNANAIDVYQISIIKTAASTYVTFGAQTGF